MNAEALIGLMPGIVRARMASSSAWAASRIQGYPIRLEWPARFGVALGVKFHIGIKLAKEIKIG